MSAVSSVWGSRSRAEGWSAAAFALAVTGLALSIWVILGSDGDTSQIRWWFVSAPVLVTAASLVLPRPGVRLGVTVALAAWCVLAVFSIGMLFVPALFAAVLAVRESLSRR